MATETTPAFVDCVRNEGFEASLAVRKLYRFLADEEAEAQSLIRVVDETSANVSSTVHVNAASALAPFKSVMVTTVL